MFNALLGIEHWPTCLACSMLFFQNLGTPYVITPLDVVDWVSFMLSTPTIALFGFCHYILFVSCKHMENYWGWHIRWGLNEDHQVAPTTQVFEVIFLRTLFCPKCFWCQLFSMAPCGNTRFRFSYTKLQITAIKNCLSQIFGLRLFVLLIVSFQSSMHITLNLINVNSHSMFFHLHYTRITEGGQEPKCVAYDRKQHLFTLWYGWLKCCKPIH